MGASNSSGSRSSRLEQLEELADNLRFEVEDESGTLRLYVNDAVSDNTRTSTTSNRGSQQQSGGAGRTREEGEGEGRTLSSQREEEVGGTGVSDRSGQEADSDGDEDEDDEDDEMIGEPSHHSTLRLLSRMLGARTGLSYTRETMKEQVPPKAVPMEPSCDLYREMMQYSTEIRARCCEAGIKRNICDKLNSRQLSLGGISQGQKVDLTQHMLPRYPCLVDVFYSRVFCGQYNSEGSMFICASQDENIYVYDTTGNMFEEHKRVHGRDVGWAILDVVFSPDQYWFAYSTWSPYINMCNARGEENKHYSLDLRPDTHGNFCAFSVRFSSDGNELITASNDGYLYVYDINLSDRTLKIDAHQDDADAVALDNQSSHIIYSAGDDGLCKVWDRRALSESNPRPVGCLAGHKDGITFIDTKGDGRYLITNSKDQTIKLWDIRKFSNQEGVDATLRQVQQQSWDYRWENVPRRARYEALVKLPGDSSVMTYTGHMVKHTLLRARFSPITTTGQKYIYTACARGRVLVYDVLTGEVVQTLKTDKYRHCIRDVSWHPTQPAQLVSSSWDGVLQLWSHRKRQNFVSDGRSRYLD